MLNVIKVIQKPKVRLGLAVFVPLLITLFVVGIRARNSDSLMLSVPLKKGRVLESVYGIGTVIAKNSNQMKLGVSSKVRQLYVTEGDTVNKGQKLADFDETGPFSAPFSGTITYLPIKVGETVFPQAVILSLVDLVNRYIVVSLEQRGAVRVRQGQRARISFDNMRDQAFEGLVEAVYSNNNSFLVRIGVSQLPSQILPGMTADVAIIIGEKSNVLVIPAAAIESGEVLVKRGAGGPKKVTVQTGILDGPLTELISGDLREGEQLYLRKQEGP